MELFMNFRIAISSLFHAGIISLATLGTTLKKTYADNTPFIASKPSIFSPNNASQSLSTTHEVEVLSQESDGTTNSRNSEEDIKRLASTADAVGSAAAGIFFFFGLIIYRVLAPGEFSCIERAKNGHNTVL